MLLLAVRLTSEQLVPLSCTHTHTAGEEWRARELTGARIKLGARFDPARFVMAASSLGETGAASGAIGVCLAARSFARSYDSNGHALVISSSEHGHVGAIRLSKP